MKKISGEEIFGIVFGAIVAAVIQIVFQLSLNVKAKSARIFLLLVIGVIIALVFFIIFTLLIRFIKKILAEYLNPQNSIIPGVAFLKGENSTNEYQDLDFQDYKIEGKLAYIIDQFGIQDGTIKLEKSPYTPVKCLKRTEGELYFMGILGSKWVTEPHVRAQFRKALERTSANEGKIKFLLINPESKGFKKLKTLRGGAISTESIKHYQELNQNYTNMEVRLYNYLPSLRLIFIDRNQLILSRYRFEREEYMESDFGWQIPHIDVDSSAPWSLYRPMELYYQQVWNNSKSILES